MPPPYFEVCPMQAWGSGAHEADAMIIYDEKLPLCSTFVLVLCMIKLMLSLI
jgi:hypothetical protein